MAGRTAARQNAFSAIDSERNYQNEKHGKNASSASAGHTPQSIRQWLLLMRTYAGKGLRVDTPEQSLHYARKVAALGVVCLEQHGAPVRGGY